MESDGACENDFDCAVCQGRFHRDRPLEEAIAEHEARKLKYSGYDCDGELCEVCDDCYDSIMKNFLNSFDC